MASLLAVVSPWPWPDQMDPSLSERGDGLGLNFLKVSLPLAELVYKSLSLSLSTVSCHLLVGSAHITSTVKAEGGRRVSSRAPGSDDCMGRGTIGIGRPDD